MEQATAEHIRALEARMKQLEAYGDEVADMTPAQADAEYQALAFAIGAMSRASPPAPSGLKIVPDAKLPHDLRIVQHGTCIIKVYGVQPGEPRQGLADAIIVALQSTAPAPAHERNDAREALLNMLADAARFDEDVDGDCDGDGRQTMTVDYHLTVGHSQLEELANAVGIKAEWGELIKDALDRAIAEPAALTPSATPDNDDTPPMHSDELVERMARAGDELMYLAANGRPGMIADQVAEWKAARAALTAADTAKDEQFLTAYVSRDAKVIGIEHMTEADWDDVHRAHIALRDRLNVRIAERAKCPFKPADSSDTAKPSRITPEWCLNMAKQEGDSEVGAGSPDHPLRVPAYTAKEGRIAALETMLRMGSADDLKARLVAHVDSGRRRMGGATITSDGKASSWGGERIMVARNPDGPEALARIEALEAEVEQWKDHARDFAADGDTLQAQLTQAREALEAENKALRSERDALLERPLSLGKMDSFNEGVSDKMLAFYWCEQAQEARAENKAKDDALRAWEAWEAALILDGDAWRGDDGFVVRGRHYEEALRLQQIRNAALSDRSR